MRGMFVRTRLKVKAYKPSTSLRPSTLSPPLHQVVQDSAGPGSEERPESGPNQGNPGDGLFLCAQSGAL